jgi:hypothetical protein
MLHLQDTPPLAAGRLIIWSNEALSLSKMYGLGINNPPFEGFGKRRLAMRPPKLTVEDRLSIALKYLW